MTVSGSATVPIPIRELSAKRRLLRSDCDKNSQRRVIEWFVVIKALGTVAPGPKWAEFVAEPGSALNLILEFWGNLEPVERRRLGSPDFSRDKVFETASINQPPLGDRET